MNLSKVNYFLNFLSSESEEEYEEEQLLLISLKTKKFKSQNAKYLSKRKSHGQFKMTLELPDETFINFYRMTREQFKEIHEIIKESIYSDGCYAQKPIGTEEKLAVLLRYLASGDSYKSIGYNFRMGDRTVSNIVRDVAIAIYNHMQPKYLPEPTTQTWQLNASRFEQRWQFPHCVGAIDGKHIVIKKPGKSGSSYFNYKHTFSVVLMATVDADYKFTTVDIGAMGRFSDGSLFSSSVLGNKMMRNALQLPAAACIPTIASPLPYVFVGDEAFPLSENLMRPYPRRYVTEIYENQVFNARLSRARQTVECTFGILASRFRVFRKPFESKVDTVREVVKTGCILHNYLRSRAPIKNMDKEDIENLPQRQLLSMRATNVRNSSGAFEVRENFKDYFNNWGAVPWQHQTVMQGNY